MTKLIDQMITFFTNLFSYGGSFLVSWCMDLIPAIFMVLILTNALIRLIPARLIEKAAVLASRHALPHLVYTVPRTELQALCMLLHNYQLSYSLSS